MGLAAIAQVLELIDPIIFGKIIDNFAVNTGGRSEQELVNGALKLLVLAVGIALLARLHMLLLIMLPVWLSRNSAFQFSIKD